MDRLDHTHKSFNAGQTGQMLEAIGQCATYLENHVGEDTVAALGTGAAARIGADF